MPLDDWKPGDCVIHNHPYFGASHSPDIAIVMPVFFEGELVGFSANTAHHVDIGAATPGLVIDIPDVYAEGMLLNGLKLYEEGVRNEALWKFIRDNTRVPGLVMGDLEAQIASAELGVLRFVSSSWRPTARTRCCRRRASSWTTPRRCCGARSPRSPTATMSRKASSTTTAATAARHLPLKVTVRVRGDDVEVDLTGSSPQVPTAFNVPFEGSTKVACYFAFRALAARYLHACGIHPAERGFVPAR